MSNFPRPNPNARQIPHAVAEQGSLVTSVQALHQTVDSLSGFRGNPMDRAVTFHDIKRLGLADETTITSPSGSTDFATNSAVAGIPAAPHTWTAEQIIAVSDNTTALLIQGSARGLRFYETVTRSIIEGRDPTGGASYQGVTLGGSIVELAVSGATKITLDGSGLTVTPTAVFNGAATFNALGHFTLGVTITGAGVVVGSPTGGDKGAGSVNAEALYVNGVAVAAGSTANSAEVTTSGSTTSASNVMLGAAVLLTPSKSGTVRVTVTGTAHHSVAGGTIAGLQLRSGTGSAPAAGAADTGTARGGSNSPQSATAGNKFPFALTATISGLTLGTQIWVDLAYNNGGGGPTATIDTATFDVWEL